MTICVSPELQAFRLSVWAYCLVSQPWKGPGSILFTSCLQAFIDIADVPRALLFSRLSSHSSLSLSSCKRRSRPFIIFVALCWTLPSMYIVLGSLDWTQYSRCSFTMLVEDFSHTDQENDITSHDNSAIRVSESKRVNFSF